MTTKKNQNKNKHSQINDNKEENEKKKRNEEIENIKQQLKEKDDQLLRSLADYQNLQNRVRKDMNLHELEIKKTYLSELLDIKELLLKALDDNDPKEGLRIILKQLENFLQDEHVTYIECVGKKFDHCLHHAVTTITNKEKDDNIIIEEIKKGYLINDNVLRPSHVVVVKNTCEEE